MILRLIHRQQHQYVYKQWLFVLALVAIPRIAMSSGGQCNANCNVAQNDHIISLIGTKDHTFSTYKLWCKFHHVRDIGCLQVVVRTMSVSVGSPSWPLVDLQQSPEHILLYDHRHLLHNGASQSN